MFKAVVEIKLELTGPILTQSSEPGAWGLDCVAARNAKGDYYLPGTLLAGKLRQAWEELSDAIGEFPKETLDIVVEPQRRFEPDLKKWLGTPTENAPPNTKQLFFSDLVYQPKGLEVAHLCSPESVGADVSDTPQKQDKSEVLTQVLNRIQIDSTRGAVAENQLVMIESPFLPGCDYDFTGELHFFAADQAEINSIVRHVNAGLQWTAQLGALRTVGFGRVKQVQLPSEVKGQALPKPSVEPSSDKLIALSIRPLYPFCIGGKPVADNLFESLDFIPGNVLLGAIATTWNHLCGQSGGLIDEKLKDPERTQLKEHFSKIRISHAFPSENNSVRPVIAPLSIVHIGKDKEDRLYDAILLEEPCLIDNEAPAFAIDWKDKPRQILAQKLGKPSIKKELRTRTAIDADSLRSADEKLFSYEQIAPENFVWNAQLDLSGIESENDRNQVLAELQSLLTYGIAALGKTKTPADIDWPKIRKPSHASDIEAIKGKQWAITLQSDTLLGAPVGLDESSGQRELEKMYKQAWSDLSAKKLQLVRYFAGQRLAGGTYLHHVYQKGGEYRPWLLTEAGSVFLVELADGASEKEGKDIIENWLTQGLPLAKPVLDYYRITEDKSRQWQHCPYIAQNGYGEIAVNLDLGFPKLESNSKQITRRIPVLKKTEALAP